MEMLKKLKFVQYKPNTANKPQLDRRRKLLDKLDEQIMLAQDMDFKPTRFKLTTDASGNRVRVEVPKRVRRWWSIAADGKVQLTIRYGSRPVEFQKGKCAIELNTEAKVLGTLETVKRSVEASEFDDLLTGMAAARKMTRRLVASNKK